MWFLSKEVLLMNKRGQSLIIFVLILPLIVFFIAYFINLSLVSLESNKVKGIVKDNIETIVQKNIRDLSKIKSAIESNNLDAEIMINTDDIKIKAISKEKIVFDNIFKMNKNIEITFCGNYQTKKIERC